MLENDLIFDLVKKRGSLFSLRFKGERFAKVASPENMLRTLSTLVNCPAFSVTVNSEMDGYSSPEVSDAGRICVPFDTFAVAVHCGKESRVVLVERNLNAPKVGDELHVHEFGTYKAGWALLTFQVVNSYVDRDRVSVCTLLADDTMVSAPEGSLTQSGDHGAAVFTRNLLRLLATVSSCKNIKFREASSTERSVAAIAKSKVPPWEYHEVELSSLPGYIYIPKGGTHASPRWHMRGGHWRNYKSGKRVWVEQMEVGDKSKGVIVKDYVVTNHLGVSK